MVNRPEDYRFDCYLDDFVAALEAWFWFSRPPIVRGLSGGLFRPPAPDMKRIYQERVATAFPVGMAEADLLRKLHNLGFTGPDPSSREKYVEIRESPIPCAPVWIVTWKADKSGVVTGIKGELQEEC
jgi:hypothetical protein